MRLLEENKENDGKTVFENISDTNFEVLMKDISPQILKIIF